MYHRTRDYHAQTEGVSWECMCATLNCYRRWLEFTSKVLSFMSVLYSECARQTLHICYLLLTPTARHVALDEIALSDGKRENSSSQ